MITVLGATGNIGGRIASNLLAKGEKVRVIARTADKLKAFAAKGADVRAGDAGNVSFLADALKGSDAVFALIPPNFAVENFLAYQNEFGEALTQAIAKSGVKKVVFLSSIAGDLPSGTGPILGVHLQEERMKKELPNVDVLSLRPAYFMENLLANVGLIKQNGINGGIIKGELSLHMIATQDIGDIATEKLLARDFKVHTAIGLTGPKKITNLEATRAIGAAIGRPDLPYVTFSSQDGLNGMISAGLKPDLAAKYVEMSESLNSGHIAEVTQPAVAGKTTIEEFVSKVFVHAFK